MSKLYVDSIQPKTTGGIINAKGMVTQVKHFTQSAVDSTATAINPDDTIPQNTEGKEFLTLAITPTNVNSKLLIQVVVNGANSAAGTLTAALFQDSTANALAASAQYQNQFTGATILTFNHYMTAGTTSETTFKVRAGGSSGTFTFNGYSSGATRRFGGVMSSSITITEIGG